VLATEMPSLRACVSDGGRARSGVGAPRMGLPTDAREPSDVPAGDQGTQVGVRAARDELDFVCHLVQHGRGGCWRGC